MASRLFQAVVGFGISMGVASVAGCGGSVEPAAASDASVDTSLAPDTAAADTATSETSPDSAPAEDTFVSPDTSVADSGVDVASDPFCDAAWPTTKGSPTTPPACLDPTGACADSGPPVDCGRFIGPYTCDHERSFSTCVSGAWVCPGELRPISECRCFGAPPPGYECTSTGLRPIEDAAIDAAPGG